MKNKKNDIPLPEGCETFRGSWILGLTVALLQVTLLLTAIFLPVSLCLALKEGDSRQLLLILIPVLLIMISYSLIGGCILLFSHLFGKPRVGILDGRVYLTNSRRSIPMSEIRSMELFLGSYRRHGPSEPLRLTVTLSHDATFMIDYPSLRFLRTLRKSLPHTSFNVDWKGRVWICSGMGLAVGVIIGIVSLFL